MASRKAVQSSGLAETPARLSFELSFVGREREITQLGALHAQRKHVLIIGPAGVGKSALVERLREQLTLLVSSKSSHLGGICEGLEPQLGLTPAGLKLLERKKRLREALGAAGRSVVFDGVGAGDLVAALEVFVGVEDAIADVDGEVVEGEATGSASVVEPDELVHGALVGVGGDASLGERLGSGEGCCRKCEEEGELLSIFHDGPRNTGLDIPPVGSSKEATVDE